MSLVLLDNISTDTVGEYKVSAGFQGMLRVSGDLDGGTITLEILGLDNSDLPLQDAAQTAITFTAVGAISVFAIPSGLSVRATLAGATSPVDVSVSLD